MNSDDSIKNKKTLEKEEEDNDYMSDDFLKQLVDTRPGLVTSRSIAKKNEMEKKHKIINEENSLKAKMSSIKQIEITRREEALQKSTLSTDNKGFNMMLKMGYKTGQSLGKSADEDAAKTSKIIEPIGIKIKTDREGLGLGEERKQKAEEFVRMKKEFAKNQIDFEKNTTKLYLDNKRKKFQLRKLLHNLHKCQRICFQLDSSRASLNLPEKEWYWPSWALNVSKKEDSESSSKKAKPNVNQDEELNEVDDTETNLNKDSFAVSLSYNIEKNAKVDLKSVYKQRLEKFLEENLDEEKSEKKNETDDEKSENDDGDFIKINEEKNLRLEDDLSENDEESEDDEELIAKKVDAICLYLREKYFYCVWCASTYDNDEDLKSFCPGLSQIDHENDE